MALAAGGCSAPEPLVVLAVEPEGYQPAFDAAIEAARERGMPPLVRDRRAGVIETNAQIAGSVLEPWRWDNASLGQTIENTVAFARRRCRFEFVEENGVSAPSAGSDGSRIPEGPLVDLTKTSRPLVLQVSVFVERAYSPGIRRGTWTRSQTTRNDFLGEVDRPWRRSRGEDAAISAPEDDLMPGPGRGRAQAIFWTPVYRDTAYEQRLLEDVRRKLEEGRQSEQD